MGIIENIAAVTRSIGRAFVTPASAHCDTEDGPAVVDGRRALSTGDINHALKWVAVEDEPDVKDAFDRAIAARTTGPAAVEAAERDFLETLVRIHRAGEGAGFDGIKPTGTQLPPRVIAADEALDAGSIVPLRGLIPDDRWAELERRFTAAVARKNYDVDDLAAARDYVAAYVSFFTYAEGEDHGHACGHHR